MPRAARSGACRPGDRQAGRRRFALGRYSNLTPDDARRKAAVAIDRIKQGLEPDPPPAAPEPTVADPADRYMEADCGHSFASRALALGEGLTMIGKPLGHTKVETTARYAHLARESVRESAVRVSDSIAADILKGYQGAAGTKSRPAPRPDARTVRAGA